MMTLLLSKIGFGGCFVVQVFALDNPWLKGTFIFPLKDHVAATFGAGVGVACVVDVGDQVVNFGKKAKSSKEK